MDALIKKAKGFFSEEVTEEYQDEDGDVKLVKKKVTKKYVPPDLTAIKMVIGSGEEKDTASMTDEELEAEKERLLGLLKSENK